MNYREDSFRRKFTSAAQHLAVEPKQLVSLKLREIVNSYEDYRHLVEILQHEVGIKCSEIKADLQGRGYLLDDGKTKLILVEHESGLEILYIAGSIASLIGLIPVVLQGWRAIRGLSSRRDFPSDRGLEVRRIDDSGHIHEEHVHGRHLGHLMSMSSTFSDLATTAKLVETEIKMLGEQVQKLTSRVEELETKPHRVISSATRSKPKSALKKAGLEKRKTAKP